LFVDSCFLQIRAVQTGICLPGCLDVDLLATLRPRTDNKSKILLLLTQQVVWALPWCPRLKTWLPPSKGR
jgi:hypothetical protein